MDENQIQTIVANALNSTLDSVWSAFKATSRDGLEYVELSNEDTGQTFIISIVNRDK